MWKIKNTQTSEYNNKDTDSQTQKTSLWLPEGQRAGGKLGAWG